MQVLFDQIQAKMDLLPNVDWQPGGLAPSMSPAVTRGGSMAPDSMGQVDTGVGSFMVPTPLSNLSSTAQFRIGILYCFDL